MESWDFQTQKKKKERKKESWDFAHLFLPSRDLPTPSSLTNKPPWTIINLKNDDFNNNI